MNPLLTILNCKQQSESTMLVVWVFFNQSINQDFDFPSSTPHLSEDNRSCYVYSAMP